MCGCMGDVEDYMTAGLAINMGRAVAAQIPKVGKVADAVLGIAGDVIDLCKNLNKDEETKKFQKKSLKILEDSVNIVKDFDQKIEQNFLKIKDSIMNINASSQLIHKAVNRYVFTMALLEYDRFKSALENLGAKFNTYIKYRGRGDEDPETIVAMKMFKLACENLDTSPSRILMQIKEIVSDEDGFFMVGMRMNNYSDASYTDYYIEIVKALDMLSFARVSYELMLEKDLSVETEHTLRETIMSISEEIYSDLVTLNQLREREYYSNLTYLYSSYIPRKCFRGYDNYLNRYYVMFSMKEKTVLPKYVYSQEYEKWFTENSGNSAFKHFYDKRFVTILKTTFQEEKMMWKHALDSLIETANVGNENQTIFYKLYLKEKLLDLIIQHDETDVKKGNESADVKLQMKHASSEENRQLNCDVQLTSEQYQNIFPDFEPEFDKAFESKILSDVNKNVPAGTHSLHHTLNNIVSLKHKLEEWESKFYINITLHLEIGNVSMANATEMQTTTQQTIKEHLTKTINDCVNNSAEVDPKLKERIISNFTRIIVDNRRKLADKRDYISAMHAQAGDSHTIIKNNPNSRVDEQIARLHKAINFIVDGPVPYVVRSSIYGHYKSTLNLSKSSEDYQILTNNFQEVWKVVHNDVRLHRLMPTIACRVTGFVLQAIHITRTEWPRNFKGFGDCLYQFNIEHNIRTRVIMCYLRLDYQEKCPPAQITDIKMTNQGANLTAGFRCDEMKSLLHD